MRLSASYKLIFAFLSGLLLLLIPLLVVQAKEPVSIDIQPATLENTPPHLPQLKPLMTVGDPLPRIQCTGNYTASIYAEGLSSPDGLAFNLTGLLHVAEESAGQVSEVSASGVVTPILTGLTNPEGIAFDSIGNLYVVEDVQNGRLLKQTPGGVTSTLGANLDAPEGVVWHSNGNLYITESNVQFTGSPFDYKSYVTKFTAGITPTRIATTAFVHSYGGITVGADNLLYITNEASGFGTNNSVLTVDPDGGTPVQFTNGLTSPEGLRFSANSQFPLYVAEEDTGGSGSGRLSEVASNGTAIPFCTGFFTIEDVALDSGDNFYVSEDTTGYIILIKAPTSTIIVTPLNISISGPLSGTVGQSYTFTATVEPISTTLPLTYIWEVSTQSPITQQNGLSDSLSTSWALSGTQWLSVTAFNAGGSVSASQSITLNDIGTTPLPIIKTQASSYPAGTTAIVLLENHNPDTVYEVWVNGQLIGTATTDTDGNAIMQYMIAANWMPGTYTLQSQLGGAVVATGQLWVSDSGTVIFPPLAISISGPPTGTISNSYAFTATVQPISVTLPLTYVWQATDYAPATYTSGLSHTVSYTWGITGNKTIQVVARNISASVTASRIIDISTVIAEYKVYLPLILKN